MAKKSGSSSGGRKPSDKRTGQATPERRQTLEAMRAQQKSAERRKSLAIVAIAGVLGLGLVAVAAVPAYLNHRNDPLTKAVASFGVDKAGASCGDVITASAQGAGEHVESGTVVKYDTAPPMFGKHDGNFLTDPRHFYTAADRPPVEKLVHSLEHGYTIVWYDDTVQGAELTALKNLADRLPQDANPGRWFMVAPWTAQDVASRGAFPAGKHVALTHWGAKDGHRQYCAKVSGAVVASFVKAYPSTDAPEPGAV